MKVGVTGAAGRVGSGLVEELHKDYNILCIERKEVKVYESKVMDISTEVEKLEGMFSCLDAVVHLAWNTDDNFRSKKILSEI